MTKYTVEPSYEFKKDLRKLGKKYPSVAKDANSLIDQLEQGEFPGNKLQGFKAELYKIRLKSSDNKKGKSGGFRIIYEIKRNRLIIRLIEIYSKSKKNDINISEIKRRLKNN